MSVLSSALDGLVAVAEAAVAASPLKWKVFDGPPSGTYPDGIVCVGFTGRHSEAAAQEVVNYEQSPSLRRAPVTWEITSQVSRAAGNGPIRTQREHVEALVAAIKANLRADPTLGGRMQGGVYWAGSLYVPALDGGPVAAREFTVRVQGFES